MTNAHSKMSDGSQPVLSLVPEVDEDILPEDRTKSGTFKLKSTPADADSAKYSFTMAYVDGTQTVRAHILWYRNVKRVIAGMAMNDGMAIHNLIQQLCQGGALTAYTDGVEQVRENHRTQLAVVVRNAIVRDQHGAETDAAFAQCQQTAYDSAVKPIPNADDVLAGMQAVLTFVCPYKALERQKEFMRRKMRKPANMKTRLYVNYLQRINLQELHLLPPFKDDQHLADDEMIGILLYGIPKSWRREMDKHDFDPYGHDIMKTVEFCERLESAEDFDPSNIAKKSGNGKHKKAKKSHPSKKDDDGGKWCEYHESSTHNTSECSVLKNLKMKAKTDGQKSRNKTWKRKSDDAKGYSKKELAAIGKKASKAAMKHAKKELNAIATKRKKNDESDDDSVFSTNSLNAMEKIDQKMKDFSFDDLDKALEDGEISV